MTMRDDPHGLMKAVYGYGIFSVLAAITSSYITGPFFSRVENFIPAARTLNKYGAGHSTTFYLLAMYAALPFAVFAMYRRYPMERIASGFSGARIAGIVLVLGSALTMFVWFIYLMPPEGSYVSTRMRALVHLASIPLALGVIYGLLFIAVALCLCILFVLFNRKGA